MAHRVATDEICVKRGMGKSPSSRRRELVRVPACCLLAPKDLACQLVDSTAGRLSKKKSVKIFVE